MRAAGLALATVLAGCGGGGSGADSGPASLAADGSQTESAQAMAGTKAAAATTAATATDLPASRAAAARFLTQATFGPTDADIDKLMRLGYSGWIDAQFALPQSLHRADWDAVDARLKAVDPKNSASTAGTINSFWKQAITGPDQLRQRVAFALSQIMVVSMVDTTVGSFPRGVAGYLDMLGSKGLGNYRDLIQGVSLSPVMGTYLSSIHNQKSDPWSGRVPDENFGREVMQLFSIGLRQLNIDGSDKLDANGKPIPTYTVADIEGMAKVFTGWGWACPNLAERSCFLSGVTGGGTSDPDRTIKPMALYPQYHSTEAKSFLGVSTPEGASGQADLKVALDTLYNHPNVGPFIGRQLIQRLVTSNPSPAYVAAVAKVFNNNGSGVRGDMRAVVKAILLNPEARTVTTTSGKLREPVLRLSAYFRAFGATSDSGEYRVMATDNPGTQLGQTPMRSPSVFNYYRPGYVAPGTASARAGMEVPEFQITHETSAAGYVNFMRDLIRKGVGSTTGNVRGWHDVRVDKTAEIALATQPDQLVERMNTKLMYSSMPAALKTEIVGAVSQIPIPALLANGSNQTAVTNAKTTRVYVATLLTLASPEFQIQK